MRTALALLTCAILVSSANMGAAQGAVDIDLAGLSLVPANNVQASLETGGEAVRVAFTKSSEEPRLLALAMACDGLPDGLLSARARCRLSLDTGAAPRVVLAFWEKGGSCWFKTGPRLEPSAELADVSASLSGPRLAAFSDDGTDALELGDVSTVWIGLLLEGPASGTLDLASAVLSPDAYRATEPLSLTGGGPGEWTVGHDPDARAELTTPNEGPDGRPCMRLDFNIPSNRHMYVVPSAALPAVNLDGYSALRLTYRATLPEGLKGLLLMIGEQGAQFACEPPPPPTDDWSTMTIPLESFKLGGWSTDDNGRLDMERASSIMVGTHGVTTAEVGDGTIWALDIELVP